MCAISFPRSRAVAQVLTLLSLTALAPLRAQNEGPVRIDLGGGQTLELILIEAGTFQQGSPANEVGRGADEAQHKVTLTRPFLLGKYPVTRAQFERFVTETHYRTDAESGPSGGFGWDGAQLTQRKEFTWRTPGFPQTNEHPVTIVTYRDANAFLQWLSRKSGRTFALPSEAQWEYAARGGGTATLSPDHVAWYKGNAADSTHPVGQKGLNGWGLGDMLGNVWEWCDDWYAPYSPGDVIDPLQRNSTLSDKPRRVLRGGSWLREAKFCRPATRYRNDASSRNADNGFRVMTFNVSTPTAPPPPVAVAQATPVRTQPPVSSAQPTPANIESGRIRISTPIAGSGESHFNSRPKIGPSFGPLLYALPIFAVLIFIVFVIRKIVRAISGNMGGSGSTGNFRYMPGQPLRVRLVDDGFWIVGDGLGVGTPLLCRYEANGQSQQTEVHYEGGAQGQFVFTGGRPANVSVSVDSGSSPMRSMGTGFGTGMTTTPRHFVNDDPPFRGHPPAY
ncbi:MAG TPA: SUMF1/EgtB/PvdO family nonheme iron enzyme [Chthoniobacter sp.]|nr:SUMF1/EgtB/PvdO family nonheme iron enzyme [Chthoniobacter sp.]